VQDAVPSWVAEQAAGRGLPVDPGLLAQAALAVRAPEVAERDAAARRRRLLATAAGAGWVVLEEAGDPAGEPARPYRRLEADPASGRSVLVRSDPDESFTSCRHTVTTGRVDLATGALLTAADTVTEHPDPAARDRRAGELRAASPTLANPPDMSDSE
jgi:hypothetical protein